MIKILESFSLAKRASKELHPPIKNDMKPKEDNAGA